MATSSMKLIGSALAKQSGLVCVLVSSTADWNQYGESAWADMVEKLRCRPPARRVMGVDSEWFKKNPLAVFQVATSSHCFVIHLSYLDQRALPGMVKQTLEDASIVKCGVGIHEDVKRLRREQNVEVRTVLGVESYAVALGLAVIGQTSLAALAEHVCGVKMVDKRKSITMSNWELPLSEEQQRYAADDAIASCLVGAAVLDRALVSQEADNATFDVVEWLNRTRVHAQQQFKSAQKAKQREAQAPPHAEDGGTSGADDKGLRPFWNEGSKIRVISKEGKYLFDCSTARAKFYVKEKGIAEITQYRPNSTRHAAEIRLLFDPQVKSRICLYDAVGLCELGPDCPYAHGVGELTEEAQRLLTSAQPSCAWCLSGTNQLMKRAIVPPSFRKYLQPPRCYPANEDFVPLCLSCNSVVTRYIDEEMKRCGKEADELLKQQGQSTPAAEVGKTISYARLLADSSKTAKIPPGRLAELKEYIWQHWTLTHMPEMERRRAVHGSQKKTAANATNSRTDATGDDDSAPQDNHGEEEKEVSHEARVDGDDDDGDDREEAGDADEDNHNVDLTAPDTPPTLTYPTCLDEVDDAFIKRLSALVPGDVQAFMTVETLMHSEAPEQRAAKEEAFIKRWRTYLVDVCKMIEKPSNVLTAEQWETLRKGNKGIQHAVWSQEDK